MDFSRKTARGLIVAAVAASAVGLAGGVAHAQSEGAVPRLIFPIVGSVAFTNDWGAARWQGSHEGTDIMAPRRTIAVAAEPGKVKFWTSSSSAGCMLYLYGKSGTTYLYIHLNNDVTKGNDNRGKCVAGMAFAKGLKDGQSVEAGQAIGYVGNSGDADGTYAHLHFEVHPNDGGAVNPHPYLMKAERLIFATAPATTVTLTVTGNVIQAATGQLTMKVAKLQAFPAGAVLDKMRAAAEARCRGHRPGRPRQQGRRREVGSEAPRSRSGRAHRADRGDARSRRRTPRCVQRGRVGCSSRPGSGARRAS